MEGHGVFIFDKSDKQVVWVRENGRNTDRWKGEVVVHGDRKRRGEWIRGSQTGRHRRMCCVSYIGKCWDCEVIQASSQEMVVV